MMQQKMREEETERSQYSSAPPATTTSAIAKTRVDHVLLAPQDTERPAMALPGIVGLLSAGAAAYFAYLQFFGTATPNFGLGIFLGFLAFWLLGGMVVIEPNGSRALTMFGKYQGTLRKNGWFFVNPLTGKRGVTLRARTLNGEKLKVNDSAGNPVEIAAIIVWKVSDTYNALFEVENYDQYVRLQSETAVRHLASTHPYDAEDHEVSLRRNTDQISEDLKSELQERLARAGVTVLEARLSHLAYAPEIAGAMLRRQQASAIIAARQKIVEGAVGMVELAIDRLDQHETFAMNDREKAALVSNLMVVLCGDHSAQPVVNMGNATPAPLAPETPISSS